MHCHSHPTSEHRGAGGGSGGSLRSPAGSSRGEPAVPLGVSPFTVRQTSSGWKPFTRMEAVAALRLMIGSCDRDPAQYALYSGRIEGATQLAAQVVPELQIQRAGRWKSRPFMTYVREAGVGAGSVSAAKTG